MAVAFSVNQELNIKKEIRAPIPEHITLNLKSGRRSTLANLFANKYASFVRRSLPTGAEELELQWKNISVTVNKGKKILDNISGRITAGQLTAIIGPSGAGKTSLLNVLCGFNTKNVSGKVLLNGQPRDMRVFKKISSYITQDCFLHPLLTVQESIKFAALLKLPATTPKDQKLQAVNDCIEFFGLTHCKNTKANSLSGGEKKRLSIAVELVSNPLVIFLDEPTSGLDSASCQHCISLLKALSNEGRTVICTIHQPSTKILCTFDQFYAMASGTCVYNGTIENLVPFLEDQQVRCPQYKNPAEILMDAVTEENGPLIRKLKMAVDALEAEKTQTDDLGIVQPQQYPLLNISTASLLNTEGTEKQHLENLHFKNARSSWQQFWILMKRELISTSREPMITHVRLAVHIVMGLVLGAICYQKGNDASKILSIYGIILVSLTMYVFLASLPALLVLPVEKKIMAWEHRNSWYGLKVYYLSKITIETCIQIILCTIFTSIFYWMSGHPNELWRFGLFLVSANLICLADQAILMIAGIFFSAENAVFLGNIVHFPVLLFCGIYVSVEDLPPYMRWLVHTSFARYGARSMMQILYSMGRPNLDCEKGICVFRNPERYLKVLGLAGNHVYSDFAALIGFVVVFRIVGYVLLRRVNRNR